MSTITGFEDVFNYTVDQRFPTWGAGVPWGHREIENGGCSKAAIFFLSAKMGKMPLCVSYFIYFFNLGLYLFGVSTTVFSTKGGAAEKVLPSLSDDIIKTCISTVQLNSIS